MKGMDTFKEIAKGIKQVLQNPYYALLVICLALFIGWLLIMVPVWTTPGNDFLFQLEILGREPIMLTALIILSCANGLLLAMQIYIKKRVTEKKTDKQATSATIGGVLLSVLSGLIVCSACYSAVLAVLGLGATAFLVTWRFPIATLALMISVYAISRAAKRINNNCEVCSL